MLPQKYNDNINMMIYSYPMAYNPFSQQIWDKIYSTLDKELPTQSEHPPIAVFDADGTLWNTDCGESFFNYQIQNKLLNFSTLDPWDYYYRSKTQTDDPRSAYLWLAQINKNHSLSLIRQWATENINRQMPFPVFPDQKKLIAYFLKHKVSVYIVTASVTWAVEPAALLLNIPKERVLGVETKVEEGMITDVPGFTLPYKEGKLNRLLEVTGGQRPFFACGNTIGDISLLENATGMSLAVSSVSQEGAQDSLSDLFEAEEKLRIIAKQKNWLTHRF